MKEKLVYWLFKLFKFIINLVPRRVNHFFARLFGSLLYYLVKKRRELAVKNIKKSLGYSEQEAQRLAKLVFQDLSIKFIETLMFEGWTDADYKNRVRVEGLEHLEKAYNAKKGVILYTGHIGSWELLGLYICFLGYPLNAIAQKHKNPLLNQEIISIRESKGAKVYDKKKGVKKAFKSLLKKEILLILGDQDARSKGTFVEFLNRPASTPNGPVIFAQKTGAVILPAYMMREGDGYRLIIEEAIEVAKDSTEDDIKERLQYLSYSLEDKVKEYPEQWLWLHRRWKTKFEGAL